MKFYGAMVLACVLSSRGLVAASPVRLDECTIVAVEMVDNVDSATAHAGDFFRFQTVNAVTAGNNVAIPARTYGYGIVSIASAAGRSGRPGSLVLEPRYLVLPGNRKLGVVMNHNTATLERSGATGNMPGYLGAIPIAGVGAVIGVFNYFHNGKNIIVSRGTLFTVFPSDDPSVERCQSHPSY
ncbi:MAG: hypothetical protein M3R51_07315 [Candidatus Eremiobacteraeota bacterium]|nr:hypothetical protein [Candidatus Eremiobacteraeota bacterium]